MATGGAIISKMIQIFQILTCSRNMNLLKH